jgi:hypothetical protein
VLWIGLYSLTSVLRTSREPWIPSARRPLHASVSPEDAGDQRIGHRLRTVAVAVFRVYQAVAGGTTASLPDTLVGQWPWLLTGIALITAGVWLHQIEL